MRRWGWKLGVLLVVAAAVFLWLIKTPLIATYLTHKLGVPVSLNWISLTPSQTKMKGFKINNPIGYKSATAFKAKQIEIDYAFRQLFSNPMEVNEIDMENVFLDIELNNISGAKNNWTAIAARMPKEGASAKEWQIHKLAITNLTVVIRGLGLKGGTKKKTIPHIEFHNISSKTGFPTKKLIQAIFEGAGIQEYIQDLFQIQPVDLIQKFFSMKESEE